MNTFGYTHTAHAPNDPSPVKLGFRTQSEAEAHAASMAKLAEKWPGEPWASTWKTRPEPCVVVPIEN